MRRVLSFSIVSLLLLGCPSDNTIGFLGDYRPGEQPDELEPPTIQDEFIQRSAVASDILFIVDDSTSMSQEQTALMTNFSYFAQFIMNSGLDWHVGVLRGDLSQNTPGELVGSPTYIDSTTLDPISAFTNRIASLGTAGWGGCESGMAASYTALTPPMRDGHNAGFYRPEAALTIVMVSDEDDDVATDCSNAYPGAVPDEWARWVRDLKGGDESLINLGIIASFDPTNNRTGVDCDSAWGGNARAAWEYERLAGLIETTTWSICNQDWSDVMSTLGLAAAGLTRLFNLSRVPAWDYNDWDGDGYLDEPVLEVHIDRRDGAGFTKVEPMHPASANPDPENSWEYDRARNAAVFRINTMPSEGWLVKAVYPTGADH